MLYRDMSIYCNSLGAIYRYGKIQYRHSSSTNTKLNSVFPAWSLNSELSSCGILCENVIFSIIFTAAFSLQAVNDDLTKTLTKIIWNEVIVPSVSPWRLVVEVQVFVVCFWNNIPHRVPWPFGRVLCYSFVADSCTSEACSGIQFIAAWYVWSR